MKGWNSVMKSKSKKQKSKPKQKIIEAPKTVVPRTIDAADKMSYQISSVIRNKKGVVTHAKIGTQLYDIKTLADLYELGYRYYTSDDGVIKRDVLRVTKKSGKCYFATEADWKKENNLDYLPLAKL